MSIVGRQVTARAGLALALLSSLATPALAASDGAGSGGAAFLWQLGNLVLLLGVLFAVARKPIEKFFAQRHEKIRGELDDASRVLAQAEERFAEWQQKLAELDSELDRVRATAERRAREEREHTLNDARAAAERIRADAVVAVEQELRRARGELREEAADLAIELAASLLREQVSDGDRKRLIDEFIERVEESEA